MDPKLRRKMVRDLRTKETIDCLDLKSYVLFLAVKIDLEERSPGTKLANVVKHFNETVYDQLKAEQQK